MHSAFIGLAHGQGTVRITRTPVWIGTGRFELGDEYDVRHVSRDGELVKQRIALVMPGESTRDAKARCISLMGMLMHWPAMLAELAQDARAQAAARGELQPPPAPATAGIILPPGVSRAR